MFKSSVLATMTMVASANEVEGWNHGPGPVVGHGHVGPLRGHGVIDGRVGLVGPLGGHGIIGRASSYSASDRLVRRGLVGRGLGGYGGVGVAGRGLGYGGVGVAGRGVLLARTDSYSISDRRGLGLGYGGVAVGRRGLGLARTDSYSVSDRLARRGLVGRGLGGYGGVGIA